ncbi:MAG TPA: YggS family pyridoxal phosphate-dependent enzyme [Chloroflexi bacterium]|nr:YggS family pyridoxal phosphate-dependent enzyme [Chloroflexota bacterium]
MIVQNLTQVQNRIAQAVTRAGRNPADVTLVGVSKHRPVEAMLAAYRAGLRHFGENRVEEILAKIPDFLAQTHSADPPTIHMIGHLQSRKVADALRYSQMIHSVDTVKLAERIDRLAHRGNHPPMPILLECNVSGEAAKAGFKVADWQQDQAVLTAFLEGVEAILALSYVQVLGLMTMAPIVSEPEQTRPVFSSLRKLMIACAEAFPQTEWRHLSMGMTDDFEVAVEEGATLLRVGRAIFEGGV